MKITSHSQCLSLAFVLTEAVLIVESHEEPVHNKYKATLAGGLGVGRGGAHRRQDDGLKRQIAVGLPRSRITAYMSIDKS